MKIFCACICFLFFSPAEAQQTNTAILQTVLSHYYKSEKPVYKGRSQLLYFFCNKPNNNEEIFETINKMNLAADDIKKIRHDVNTDIKDENWQSALDEIYTDDKTNLNIKINACLSVDEYHEKRKILNLNNQRLMIVSKPIFYGQVFALVKVVFYRSIEHNNGSVLLMEQVSGKWIIRDFLNPWAT